MEKALFGAGCFWGVEDFFRQVPGVSDAVSGYAGGTSERPTYKQVCSDSTGHAEVVEVTFDPARVAYGDLVDLFFYQYFPRNPAFTFMLITLLYGYFKYKLFRTESLV